LYHIIIILSISQGYIVEGQILQKFLGKFQKIPEKNLPISLRELEGIKTKNFSSLVYKSIFFFAFDL